MRQTILDANANPGLDTIAFDIPGSGVQTIAPASSLPTISDPVIVDGYMQPGAVQNTDPAGFYGTADAARTTLRERTTVSIGGPVRRRRDLGLAMTPEWGQRISNR